MSKVILYSTKRRIALTDAGLTAPNWNYPMHNPDFRAYKGAQTDVEFVVRNIDRKPIPLTMEIAPGIEVDAELVGTIIDQRSGDVLFQKSLTVVDARRGIARLSLTAVDLMGLSTGFLSYTVSQRSMDGAMRLLSVDQYEQARGFFEVMDGALPIIKPSMELLAHQFTPISVSNGLHLSFVSSAFAASSVFGITTIAIYTSNYSGSFQAQGNLADSAEQDDSSWFVLPLSPSGVIVLDRHTGTQAHTVEANLQWIRFLHTPASNNAGSIEKVLFRN